MPTPAGPRDLEDVRVLLIRNPLADLAMIDRILSEFSRSVDQPLSERLRRIEEDARGPEETA